MLLGSMTAKRGLMGAGRVAPTSLFDARFPSHKPDEAFDPRAAANAMPGQISGYGGGTWNADGSVATPVNRMGDAPMFQPTGGGSSAFGWDGAGTDTLPALPPPPPSQPAPFFASHSATSVSTVKARDLLLADDFPASQKAGSKSTKTRYYFHHRHYHLLFSTIKSHAALKLNH